MAIAGEPLSVNCSVIIPDGVSSLVNIHWVDSSGIVTMGDELTVGAPVIVGGRTVLPIDFDPLRADHGNRFFCQVSVNSPAPPYNISQQAELAIIVQGSFSYGIEYLV